MSFPAPKIPPAKKEKKRYIRKRGSLAETLHTIKLWPSRTGVLHGIRSVASKGADVEFTTHCGQKVRLRDSKTSRVARWIRNKWYVRPCPGCKVPEWKLQKYSATSFK